MTYFGDHSLGQTVRIPWATYDAAGASVVPTGGTIRVYEAGNNVELVTPGVTDTRGFDTIIGLHEVAIAATQGNGYAVGKDYYAVLVGATIDAQTVNAVLGTFSIQNRAGGVDAQAVRDAMKLAPSAGAAAAGSIDTLVAAQAIRDAMKLAPSVGAPAAGSIDQELDSITTDPAAEITQIPPAATSPLTMIRALYALCFNRNEQTATTRTLRNRAGNAVIGTQSSSDDQTTAVKGSWT